MMRKIFITLTLCTLAFAGFSQAFVKGTGIRYDRGVPTVAPDTTYGTEFVINLLTRDNYQWDRNNEQWLLSSNLPRPVVETLDTALTFTYPKYYSSYSASSDLIFTADTTNGKYGAYTIARIDFDTVPITFSGAVFDSIQFYNIASGDTLYGVHMVYFENTPYGVAVSVPTNARTTQDTVSGGGETTPADSIPGLIAEWDGRYNISVNDTITSWTDRKSSYVASNALAADQPVLNGTSNGLTFDGGDFMDISTGINSSGSYTWTLGVSMSSTGDNTLIGGGSANFLVRNSNVTYNSTKTFTTSQTTGNHIYQIACNGGNCELFVDNSSVGTITGAQQLTFDEIGEWFNGAGGQGHNGDIFYISFHQTEMNSSQLTSMFNFVNTTFSLGL